MNGGFFFEGLSVGEATFLKNRGKWVVLGLLCGVILLILLAHLHLVACFSIDGLIQDANKDVLRVLSTTLLIDSLLALLALLQLREHLLLLTVDLLLAVDLKIEVLLLDLLLLRLLLVLIVLDILVSKQVITVPLFGSSCNLALFVVVVDQSLLCLDVEFSLLDLVSCWEVSVQLKLLSHLVHEHISAVVVFLQFLRILV